MLNNNEKIKNLTEVKEIIIKRKNNNYLTYCLMLLPILSLISTIEDITSIYKDNEVIVTIFIIGMCILTVLLVLLIFKRNKKYKLENKQILKALNNLEKDLEREKEKNV